VVVITIADVDTAATVAVAVITIAEVDAAATVAVEQSWSNNQWHEDPIRQSSPKIKY
jgi:hypothetical protein